MTYDVVIVGAGPAGLACALHLGSHLQVALVTRRPLGASKPCGGLLGPEATDLVSRLGTRGTVFCRPSEVAARIELGSFTLGETFRNIHRGRLETALAGALDPGVGVLTLRDAALRRETEGYTVIDTVTGQEHRCRFLIVADGVRSSTRRKLGYPAATARVMEQVILPRPTVEARLVFDTAVTPRDYYWIIPNEETTVVGYPLLDRSAVWAAVGRRFPDLKIDGSVPRERYPLTRLRSLDEVILGGQDVFLAGEAAGLVMPLTGDGLTGAFESAQALGEILRGPGKNRHAAYREAMASRIERLGREIVPQG
jgi:flavin-dependent dehydrogenase